MTAKSGVSGGLYLATASITIAAWPACDGEMPRDDPDIDDLGHRPQSQRQNEAKSVTRFNGKSNIMFHGQHSGRRPTGHVHGTMIRFSPPQPERQDHDDEQHRDRQGLDDFN